MGAETIALLVAHSDIQVMFIHVETQGGMHGSKLAGSSRDRWPTKEWKMKLSGIDWDRNSRDYSRRLNCDLVNRWMRTVAVNL